MRDGMYVYVYDHTYAHVHSLLISMEENFFVQPFITESTRFNTKTFYFFFSFRFFSIKSVKSKNIAIHGELSDLRLHFLGYKTIS